MFWYQVSVFETAIRVFGGLLSAYDLSKDPVFLEKATDIGDRLMRAFGTKSGVPAGQIGLNGKFELVALFTRMGGITYEYGSCVCY